MEKQILVSNRALIRKLSFIQLLVCILLLVFFSALAQQINPLSIICGGLIAMSGKLIFGWWFFKDGKTQRPETVVRRAYLAEVLNIVTTLLAFVLVFVWVDGINYPVLFVSFILVQSVYWVAPIWVR